MSGALGPDAYRFVDFLSAAGAGVWQILPLVPTHSCGSPYHGQSIHAGNQSLISAQKLHQDGLVSGAAWQEYLDQVKDASEHLAAHGALLKQVYRNHLKSPSKLRDDIVRFSNDNASWIWDYALYRVMKLMHEDAPWYLWPAPLRDRDPDALAELRDKHSEAIEFVVFEQYLFWQQWERLKKYANNRGIRIMGDIPIFPAHDSAEVWAHPYYFQLDDTGRTINVAGVPPDYFSATGQLWGNPLYDWQRLQEDEFKWWTDRIRLQLKYFDLLRLDHFRGFQSYWSVPAASQDATQGHWDTAPGDALFNTLQRTCAPLSLIAEDLGHITPEVMDLRHRFGLPGMRVLQFAFDGDPDNLHLPHNHEHCGVVYTGTHDNDTTCGWFYGLDSEHQQRVYGYLGMLPEIMPWALVRTAMASVSRLAMVPMQDVMALDGASRMNMPGTDTGNWRWRFDWADVPSGSADRLRHLASVYARVSH